MKRKERHRELKENDCLERLKKMEIKRKRDDRQLKSNY